MIDFVVAGLVLGDSRLGVRLSFKPCWYCSHLLGVARNAHVLSSYLECVTERQLRIRKNWRGLLGEGGTEREATKKRRLAEWTSASLLGLAEVPDKQHSDRFFLAGTINVKVA